MRRIFTFFTTTVPPPHQKELHHPTPPPPSVLRIQTERERERERHSVPPKKSSHNRRIAAGGRDSFAQLFLSGTASTIAISAPSGDRVALSVMDKDDKPVCKREGARGGACRWVPLFTQRYTIEVQNLGASDARYFLVIE